MTTKLGVFGPSFRVATGGYKSVPRHFVFLYKEQLLYKASEPVLQNNYTNPPHYNWCSGCLCGQQAGICCVCVHCNVCMCRLYYSSQLISLSTVLTDVMWQIINSSPPMEMHSDHPAGRNFSKMLSIMKFHYPTSLTC